MVCCCSLLCGLSLRKCLLLIGLCLLVFHLLQGEQQTLSLYSSAFTVSDILDPAQFPLPEGLTVAYAISITYCHPDDFIADAAAVLQHSIHLQSSRSRYDYQMYAFVHLDAQNCTKSLQHLGYNVLIKDTPVRIDQIKNLELRKDATTTGCCQEKEFLKLYALTLTDHPIVVHLDLDTLLLQPLDALFDNMMLPDSRAYYSHIFDDETTERHPPTRKYVPDALWTPYKTIPITAYFMRDYNMVKQLHVIPPNRINVQGGFWMVQPNRQVYDELVAILKDGHEYTTKTGWGSSTQLHPSAYYGVAQIQGLLSYYYGFVRPGSSVELNKCIYNNMVDQPRKECNATGTNAHYTKGQCLDCRTTPLEQVKSIHLTLCQKPWWCPLWIQEPQCSKFHNEWHQVRRDLEVQRGLVQPPLVAPDVDTTDMRQVLGQFPTHCTRQGSKGYRPIQFDWAAMDNNDQASERRNDVMDDINLLPMDGEE